ARTPDALRRLVDAADSYAIPGRAAMADDAVAARAASPMSIVFRGDAARTQLLRHMQPDPALRELTRWATATQLVKSLRDGWIGIEPGADTARPGIRVTASAEWLAELANAIELQPADRARINDLPAGVDWAVAL